jgi:hypothetical protein
MSETETEKEHGIPGKVTELVDELDQEVRRVAISRALQRLGVSAQLLIHAVEGLRHLLAGDREHAARTFEAIVEEVRDTTFSLD